MKSSNFVRWLSIACWGSVAFSLNQNVNDVSPSRVSLLILFPTSWMKKTELCRSAICLFYKFSITGPRSKKITTKLTKNVAGKENFKFWWEGFHSVSLPRQAPVQVHSRSILSPFKAIQIYSDSNSDNLDHELMLFSLCHPSPTPHTPHTNSKLLFGLISNYNHPRKGFFNKCEISNNK